MKIIGADFDASEESYIAQLEQDFQDAGYRVAKVILPTGMSRELYVDLEGREEYYKSKHRSGFGSDGGGC